MLADAERDAGLDVREAVVAEVQAEAQARHLRRLLAAAFLRPEEERAVTRGRLSVKRANLPSRLKKTGDESKYRDATGLEALLGGLFFRALPGGPPRLHEIMFFLGLAEEDFLCVDVRGAEGGAAAAGGKESVEPD